MCVQNVNCKDQKVTWTGSLDRSRDACLGAAVATSLSMRPTTACSLISSMSVGTSRIIIQCYSSCYAATERGACRQKPWWVVALRQPGCCLDHISIATEFGGGPDVHISLRFHVGTHKMLTRYRIINFGVHALVLGTTHS